MVLCPLIFKNEIIIITYIVNYYSKSNDKDNSIFLRLQEREVKGWKPPITE
jgi:hypothetical protein